MTVANCDQANWEELLERIKNRTIIPVIGQGLYWIEKKGLSSGVLLYDFLAKKIAKEAGYKIPSGINHKFSKAAFQFLEAFRKEVSYYKANRMLNQYLIDTLGKVKLSPYNSLWKLSRIKAFNLFINTTYDNILINTLKDVRNYSCHVLNYALNDKKPNQLKEELFDELEDHKCTLVYNLYGNLRGTVDSAFTEKDILETIVSFQKNIGSNPYNRLSQELERKSLLFMGCGYDDWLFRFFIRILSNQPFEIPSPDVKDINWKFVNDIFANNKKPQSCELYQFLKCYDSKVFYFGSGKGFVDNLFEKLGEHYPDEIIPVSEFPETVFISFNGKNRSVAFELESQLRNDGIKAWVDMKKFKPGDKIDNTIINGINKCPVFVPLISKESEELLHDGEQKYHFQEWNWVLLFNETAEKQKTIIPVIIDDTNWMYGKFKDFLYVRIPGGKGGQYDELKKYLLELQLLHKG
jgi:hypothetical protein